jgi:hypothetical protein
MNPIGITTTSPTPCERRARSAARMSGSSQGWVGGPLRLCQRPLAGDAKVL